MDENNLRYLFRHLHVDVELACEFISTFSRMEYALKATPDYLDARGVKADWDTFANEQHARLIGGASAELNAAMAYLLDERPKKQVFLDGRLEFVDRPPDATKNDTWKTLRMLRRVRNNLFHGGKLHPGGEQNQGRNEALVSASLVVLKALVPLNPLVQRHFEE